MVNNYINSNTIQPTPAMYLHTQIIITQRIQWMMHMEQSRQHNAHEHQDCTIAQGIIRPSDNPGHLPTPPIFVLFLNTKQQYTSPFILLLIHEC